MYALVDCNNFYASCERLFRPELNGKPVVVLSNNDGCVIARSNEAKALGIPMGAPAFEYKSVFEAQAVAVFSANFALYGDMSNRVMDVLSTYAPDVEIYSIDEIFLALNGFEHYDLFKYGLAMKNKVGQWTGIPISIGIAPTKALAKLANRIAKKYPDITKGSYVIDTEEKRVKALKWLKIEDVWGIGRQLAKRLRQMDVTTAWDFTQMDPATVQQQLSIVGARLQMELQGKPVLQLDEPQVKKSIATTRSFEQDYTTWEALHERVTTYAVTCAEKLRRQHSKCQSLNVFITTNSHKEAHRQYSRNILIKLPYATNSSIELAQFATKALMAIYKEGYAYKKAGVIVQDLVAAECVQANLFQNSDTRHEALMQAIDSVNARMGAHKVHLATQDNKRIWKMKQEHLSPHYTTDINDIMVVKM